jgi:DNA-binding NtrC family response regulator
VPERGPGERRIPRILLVDDEPANLDLLQRCLQGEGYVVHAARDGERALALASRTPLDAVLLDVRLPGMDGFEVCRALKQDAALRHLPVLFITARDDPAARAESFRAGGVDHIAKPFEDAEVRARVRVHVELSLLRRELEARNAELERRVAEAEHATEQLRREEERRRSAESGRERADARAAAAARRETDQWGVGAIVGRGAAICAVRDELAGLRGTHLGVLITGESGTGKELFARALHLESDRAAGPFVAINCAAIPAELAESALFGHVKGAFSGAFADHPGHFAAARGGTLFLDEVGAMPPVLQPKLLRVLEEGRVQPVGGVRAREVDVRVVAATNADPARDLESGRLRHDLYFRLARYTLRLPPLRERGDDVLLLARHFLERFASEMGRPCPALHPSLVHRLRSYRFPGNVRELRNMVEHALLRSTQGVIRPEHVHFLADDPGYATVPPAPASDDGPAERLLAHVRHVGRVTNTEARRLLGVSPRRATYLLGRLVAEGRLERRGARRWTRYELP